jgi:hypothetical protein
MPPVPVHEGHIDAVALALIAAFCAQTLSIAG